MIVIENMSTKKFLSINNEETVNLSNACNFENRELAEEILENPIKFGINKIVSPSGIPYLQVVEIE